MSDKTNVLLMPARPAPRRPVTPRIDTDETDMRRSVSCLSHHQALLHAALSIAWGDSFDNAIASLKDVLVLVEAEKAKKGDRP